MLVKNFRTSETKEVDTKVYTNDMDLIVECPQCGKRVKFGSLYNSGDWFEPNGVWCIGICTECAEKEWSRKEDD